MQRLIHLIVGALWPCFSGIFHGKIGFYVIRCTVFAVGILASHVHFISRNLIVFLLYTFYCSYVQMHVSK